MPTDPPLPEQVRQARQRLEEAKRRRDLLATDYTEAEENLRRAFRDLNVLEELFVATERAEKLRIRIDLALHRLDELSHACTLECLALMEASVAPRGCTCGAKPVRDILKRIRTVLKGETYVPEPGVQAGGPSPNVDEVRAP